MTSTTSTSLFGLLVTCLTIGSSLGLPHSQCPPGSGMSWLADPTDCSKFYVCHASRRFEFDCGINVWDPETKTCVGKGSHWDKYLCDRSKWTRQLHLSERRSNGSIAKELDELHGLPVGHSGDVCVNSPTAIYPKADNCAQYYDCSSREATVTDDPRVVECKFPLLFNPESKRCEHFDEVKCGDRKEPLDACDYVDNQCQRSAHCVPCNVRFPSCRGLPDGLNAWAGREYSPYYVLCEKERPLYQGQCDNSQGTQLFDPVNRVCAEMKKEENV